ncbi:MAG: phosphatidate cytidylyltransferase, partial [Gammaproteobacteria bacterium]|nr:phosphatidate cytidylyltransferase [Gammaproteobacteria bacterium]
SGFITQKRQYKALYVVATIVLMWLVTEQSLPMAYWHGFILPQSFTEWFVDNQAARLTLMLGLLWWLVAFVLLVIYPRLSKELVTSKMMMVIIGWLLLLPTWVAVVGIRSMGIVFDHNHGAELLLFVLLIIWAADTGAFMAGKKFGKTKLAPLVSPKKTWEGVLGGVALAGVIVALGIYLLHFKPEQTTSLIGLSLLIVIFSVVGDLTESIFKRLTGIKDSGKILPGHGGILDRIDGVTAALPITLLGLSFLGIQ